jgi:hypothetical protein
MLENGQKISSNELVKNSVQVWADKISKLGLKCINGHEEIYRWFDNGYDPEFLGYMKYVLEVEEINKLDLIIV